MARRCTATAHRYSCRHARRYKHYRTRPKAHCWRRRAFEPRKWHLSNWSRALSSLGHSRSRGIPWMPASFGPSSRKLWRVFWEQRAPQRPPLSIVEKRNRGRALVTCATATRAGRTASASARAEAEVRARAWRAAVQQIFGSLLPRPSAWVRRISCTFRRLHGIHAKEATPSDFFLVALGHLRRRARARVDHLRQAVERAPSDLALSAEQLLCVGT